MKKLFKYAVMACAVALGAMTVTSCGDDPDPEPDPKPVNPDPINPDPVAEKVQISSLEINDDDYVRKIQFKYEKNLLSSIKEVFGYTSSTGYNYIDETISNFSWNPLSVSLTTTDEMTPHKEGTLVTTVSSEGYITSVYLKEDPAGLKTYEYDNSGRLIKIVTDDPTGKGWYQKIVLTWEQGLLTKVTEDWREGISTGVIRYDFTYGEKDNLSGIWPAGICYGVSLLDFDPGEYHLDYYLQTGLFGIAPSKLPVKVESTSSNQYDNYIYEFLYGLNEKGYVANERVTQFNKDGKLYDTYAISYTYR